MAMYNDAINAYVNRLVRSELYSNQFLARPLLFFLAGEGQYNLDALVRPYGKKGSKNPNENWKFGVSVGGNMGLAKRMTTLGSVTHEFRFQKSAPTSASNVAIGASTPTASSFSEDLVGTTGTNWTKSMIPWKIRNSNLEAAKGKTAIAALLEEALSMTRNQHFSDIQSEMHTGTLTSTQQGVQEWANLLGLDHLVSDGTSSGETSFTHIGKVDRTTETFLKSTTLLAATLVTNGDLPSTQPTLDLISNILTNSSLGGICNYAGGSGDLVITTGDLWNVLREEAEDQAVIVHDASTTVQGMGKTVTFKQPVIQHGKTRITYDPDCPSGNLYVLSSGSFCYEVASGNNYRVQDMVNKAETEEGGEDYSWGKIIHKHRLTCTSPWLNVKVTGLAA